MPNTLLFSFLLSSSKDVSVQRMEPAIRVKIRRNKNTTQPPSLRSHLHSPGDPQPMMVLAKMDKITLKSIEKGHGEAAELHNLPFT